MSKLSSIWTSSRLSLAIKMRLYNSLIISIIIYSSASWIRTMKKQGEMPRTTKNYCYVWIIISNWNKTCLWPGRHSYQRVRTKIMDTYRRSKETSQCLQHKSPQPHCGRPLVRLRYQRLNSYPHRTTPSNDNNPPTVPRCLRTHMPSPTRHPSHRHSGVHPHLHHGQEDDHHSVGLTKSWKTPRCPWVMSW